MPVKSPISRVVVLMLENRSFDHMLGRFTALPVNGILSGGNVKPNLTNAWNSGGKQQLLAAGAPAVLEMTVAGNPGFEGPSHSFPSATDQLYGTTTPTSAQLASPAPLSGFMQNYQSQLTKGTPAAGVAAVPMSSFNSGDLPALWQLASEFCVCDNWFSEVPGPTEPNRLFTHAGTSVGLLFNPWGDMDINAPTIYDELDKAGQDWTFFHSDLSDSDNFPALKIRTDRVVDFSAFAQQAAAGTLPSYSFICPRYNDAPPLYPNSQHPPYNVQNGEQLVADVYDALRGSPLWNNVLLIVTYDEHGGIFDHVPPPSSGVSSPDNRPAPTPEVQALAQRKPTYSYAVTQADYKFNFDRLGLRVPAILVSSWIPQGTVDSTQYQHTSILATLRDLFGVSNLTNRDAQAASFLKNVNLQAARTDCPIALNRPATPPTPATADEMQLPLTDPQKELVTMVQHLDGHPDSGKPLPPLPTRAVAANYLRERRFAHNEFHRNRRRRAAYNVIKEANGMYSWSFVSDDGQILAKSAVEYDSQAAAEAVIAKMRDLAPYARQV